MTFNTYDTFIPASTIKRANAWLTNQTDDMSLFEDCIVSHIYEDGYELTIYFSEDERTHNRLAQAYLYDNEHMIINNNVYEAHDIERKWELFDGLNGFYILNVIARDW